jgi:hypothetical protein
VADKLKTTSELREAFEKQKDNNDLFKDLGLFEKRK